MNILKNRLKQEKPYHSINTADMAPCKVNRYQPSRQNRDQDKFITELRL